MKTLLTLTLILAAVNSLTLWDYWNNFPTRWVPSTNVSTTYGLSGWIRNGKNGQFHFSGQFSNITHIFTQYMYWKASNPSVLILCGPKYYLYNEALCRVDPYYKTGTMNEFCVPNYFNHDKYLQVCNPATSVNARTYGCCYENDYTSNPNFIKDFKALSPYPATW